MPVKRFYFSSLRVNLFLVLILFVPSIVHADSLRFGVLPRQAPVKLAEIFVPLARYLSEEAGIAVEFETAPNFSIFQERLNIGEYDLAHTSPTQYIQAHRKAKYKVIARYDELLTSLIVVRKDSGIKQIKDLRGRSLVLGEPQALTANLMPRWYLKKHGINPERDMRVKIVGGTLEALVLAVHSRDADASGVAPSVFRTVGDELRRDIMVLAETDGLASGAFVLHPRITTPIIEKLRTALVGLDRSERGRAILKGIGYRRLVESIDSDYDQVRRFAQDIGLPY